MSGSSPIPFQDVSLNPEQLVLHRDDLSIVQIDDREILFAHRLLSKYKPSMMQTIEDSEQDEGALVF